MMTIVVTRVDYKPRRENGFGDRPQRSFGGEDRPRRQKAVLVIVQKRSFGGEERPRRAVREEHFNQEPLHERRHKIRPLIFKRFKKRRRLTSLAFLFLSFVIKITKCKQFNVYCNNA